MSMSISRKNINWFEKKVRDFFHKAGREHLPWRHRTIPQAGSWGRESKISAYEVWVSEIMLQQTQVARVTHYYERFLKRFPTVRVLAEASWEDFLPLYAGLGYYARGRNMLKTAQTLMREYGGVFPRDKKLLETLPGIGPYTASAIMSFAYGADHLAWDTNLKRVTGRFFFGEKRGVRDENFWEKKFHTSKQKLNAALMDFGSAVCVSRPRCGSCPLQSQCQYYREKGKGEIRDKRDMIRDKKKDASWREAQVHVFLHENHKKYFSARRKVYVPFVLPAGYNTRAGIKEYFLKKYSLAVSVRPPHEKTVIDGRPTLLVNAQILTGTPMFAVFPKSSVRVRKRKTDV